MAVIVVIMEKEGERNKGEKGRRKRSRRRRSRGGGKVREEKKRTGQGGGEGKCTHSACSLPSFIYIIFISLLTIICSSYHYCVDKDKKLYYKIYRLKLT